MERRPAFAGGDQAYLREVQYANGGKLDARSRLHHTYSTAPLPLAAFEAQLIECRADAEVLEVGCGTGGFWSNGVVPASVNVTMTDLSPGMVREGVDRATARGYRPEGRVCDVQDLPFAHRAFDVVLANHMLYHVPDPDRAVAELARVVRADGVVLAATNGYGHMREINDAIAEVFGGRAPEGLYEVFGIDTGEARLRRRFASVTWHAFDNDLVVDDPAAVVAYGLSFPPGESANAEQAAAFDAAVRRRFVDGRLRIHTRSGVFVARRPR
jgi:2-polyprenyl-3-methyl-5-hydroxy-6-metoxy-1,4-benzoquinol methylase